MLTTFPLTLWFWTGLLLTGAALVWIYLEDK